MSPQTILEIVSAFSFLGLIFSMYIAWSSLQLQKTETIKQNQRIIELLEELAKR